jgi:hypothetical protein
MFHYEQVYKQASKKGIFDVNFKNLDKKIEIILSNGVRFIFSREDFEKNYSIGIDNFQWVVKKKKK